MTNMISNLKTKAILKALAAGTALAYGAVVWAHNPVAECKALDKQTVECKGGFSDGSDAAGVTLDVLDYEDHIILPGKLNKESKLRFNRPVKEFYVLFDAGPGHVVEIDHSEIQ